MSVPRAVGWLAQPHEQRLPGSAKPSKWTQDPSRAEVPEPDESGVLPAFVEREPVGAVAGHFPELPPIPKSAGVGARLPDRCLGPDITPVFCRPSALKRCDD